MKLFLITQPYKGYDSYDSMVIAANNPEDAYHLASIQAGVYEEFYIPDCTYKEPVWRYYYKQIPIEGLGKDWDDISEVTIKLIADKTTEKEGIVLTSFNAG